MFTVLSCDTGRIATYWVVSTYLIYFTLPASTLERMGTLIKISKFSTHLAAKIRVRPMTKIITTFLFIFIGIPSAYKSLYSWYQSTYPYRFGLILKIKSLLGISA